MNLVLHGVEDFAIIRDDTLRNPAFVDPATGGLATFDCVIANPPFSLQNWGRDVWQLDPWGRASYGLPPTEYGDFAWVQHMVASMAPRTGRMAVVLPQGALFRKNSEGRIRQKLLEADLVEAVIGLAPNLFFGTGLSGSIMVLRNSKPKERQNKVLIVDASRLFRKGRAQNHLDPEHAAQIVTWFQAFEDVPTRVKVVNLDEIKTEGWILNITRYVPPPIGEDIPALADAISAFRDSLEACRSAEEQFRKLLTNSGRIE